MDQPDLAIRCLTLPGTQCEGVSAADAHRAVLPASPLMTMAGVVSHLRWAEHLWFSVLFLGEPATGPMFDGNARTPT